MTIMINDDNDFVDDVLNVDDDDDNTDDDQDDVDVPYGIYDDDDDDKVNVHNDDTCHNTSGYCKTWDIGVNNK